MVGFKPLIVTKKRVVVLVFTVFVVVCCFISCCSNRISSIFLSLCSLVNNGSVLAGLFLHPGISAVVLCEFENLYFAASQR